MSTPLSNLTGAQTSANNVQKKPLILNEGQMIHGQIKKLFPGQLAEIQIGSQKMIAKLEVPMKAGDSYYFQVNSVSPDLQLKVIAGPTGTTESHGRQLTNLMEAMQLPKTSEMKVLLSFVIKNKIPISREGLVQAESLLKNVPPTGMNNALISIQKMSELKLPFTESMFHSILGVESKEGLHAVLLAFKNTVMNDSTIPPQMKATINASLTHIAQPFSHAVGSALLGQSVLMLLDRSQSVESRFANVQLMKNSGFLPTHASLANLPQVLASLLTDGSSEGGRIAPSVGQNHQPVFMSAQTVQDIRSHLRQLSSSPSTMMTTGLDGLKSLITAEAGLNSQNKEMLLSIVNRAMALQPSTESATRFVQQFGQAFTEVIAGQVVANPFKVDGGPIEQLLTVLNHKETTLSTEKLEVLMRSAESSDNPGVQRLMQSAEDAVSTAVNGKAIKDAIQMITRSLGLNYESLLLGKESDIGRLSESLKPQLIALMQDPTITAAVRESAELIVMRMNGPLLLSGENGVQHQLIMQVPLDFFGKRIDATLQWNGRMQDDGKIDPDFARILFYLDLHSLDKTIIDMQVQNRIVSVTVFNADSKLETVGVPMQSLLKKGLESAGYKLSGVFFKKFEEDEKNECQETKHINFNHEGVDFRI